ncbi:MAG: sialyltransferase, partial [Methanobrevibacter sp.]|nr:sialyltransferase [Methanobrevibacter sp.]
MTFTVKEICQKIWNLEEKYELNHKEIQDCYPWQLIRMYLYYEITRKTNVFESAQQSSLSLLDKVESFLPFAKNSVLSNPLSGNETVDVLIFDHPRKVMFNDEYQDIYSYFLKDTLNEYGKSFETIESPYLNKHFRNNANIKENHVKFKDRILLGSFIHKSRNRGKLPFTEEEKQFIDTLKNEIESNFNIDIDLFRIMEDHILNFQYDYKKYIELLQKRKPKEVFLVVAYENKALVAACKKMNIEIIELQHGTISPYHLGYSYPENTMKINDEIKEIEYFPDKILSFGDYWANSSYFPIDKENIISMGFPYFEENSKTYMTMNENKNEKDADENNNKQILFISQGVIGKYLSKMAYETAENINNENKDKNHNFIYKLHPGEYGTWKENYDYLTKAAQNYDNFTVIDKSEPPLYELFAKSNYQVGAFSTAIYEGLAFNCKTFILDVPGVE